MANEKTAVGGILGPEDLDAQQMAKYQRLLEMTKEDWQNISEPMGDPTPPSYAEAPDEESIIMKLIESLGYAASGYRQSEKERAGSLRSAYGQDFDEKATIEYSPDAPGGKQVGTEWSYAKSPERAKLLKQGDIQQDLNISQSNFQQSQDENEALRNYIMKLQYKAEIDSLLKELKKPQGAINQEIRKSDANISLSKNRLK